MIHYPWEAVQGIIVVNISVCHVIHVVEIDFTHVLLLCLQVGYGNHKRVQLEYYCLGRMALKGVLSAV